MQWVFIYLFIIYVMLEHPTSVRTVVGLNPICELRKFFSEFSSLRTFLYFIYLFILFTVTSFLVMTKTTALMMTLTYLFTSPVSTYRKILVISPPAYKPHGATQQSFIRGGSAPTSKPLPFYIPFLMEKVPLSYTFHRKFSPFIYLGSEFY